MEKNEKNNRFSLKDLPKMSRQQKMIVFRLESRSLSPLDSQILSFRVNKEVYSKFEIECVKQGLIWDEAVRLFMDGFNSSDFKFE